MKTLYIAFAEREKEIVSYMTGLLRDKKIEWICPFCGEIIETCGETLVNKTGFNLRIDCPACDSYMIANKILEDKQ